MELVRLRYFLYLLLVTAGAFAASQPWTKDPSQWTSSDVQKLFTDSPWAQQVMASFGKPLEPDDMPVAPPLGAQGGMTGPRGASDGRWDGGVARNTGVGESPMLPVTVRWDSAGPVRQALSRSKEDGPAISAERAAKDYVITVIGLVPASTPASAEHPATEHPATEHPPTDPAHDPEQIQGFIMNSRLVPRGQPPIPAEDAAIDAATGAVHLFFPRTRAITLRVKALQYKGQLEL